MATTPNYGWTVPTVGGSNSVWGGILNATLTAVDAALFSVSGVASAALAKAGGTMTGDITLRVPTAPNFRSVGYRGGPFNAQNTDYILALADIGCVVRCLAATPVAYTIPPQASVAWLGLSANEIGIVNAGSSTLTLTRGVGVSLYASGGSTDANIVLPARTIGRLVKLDDDKWAWK